VNQSSGFALGLAGRWGEAGVDHEAVTVLHQHVTDER